ncbi:alkaline shock response membrane anchor protein AmaP [Desulforamulus aeronauticus]|uniref:Uncharacterized conserved protein YloU, alkaline shock protein (Asp23) family n=1 Tax=Desulforamulus aeronauticus DSM 10349 TaxID=1121421 RepID=A0A1M6PFX7_9FIRM|nr:alkaline shock response membrane anchor protein AmaP [Desulforamulus aeronauticus]SHK06843.1 Uncharacterized conserved protein YloU, alkaline shock protein (Asp23) family [Desulforamulus aeronauticus DSM 10349]
MTPFDRGLLIIYTVVTTVLSSLLLMIISGWWQQPLYFLWQGPYVYNGQLYLALIFGVLLLIGLRLFWVSLTRRNNSGKAVVHDYKLGQVRISVLAIENLVKKAVGQMSGIKEVKPRVVEHKKGMGLHIRAVVTPDISIPEVSREIQQKVQEYLAQTTGITVSEIKVIVDNISTTRPRVE